MDWISRDVIKIKLHLNSLGKSSRFLMHSPALALSPFSGITNLGFPSHHFPQLALLPLQSFPFILNSKCFLVSICWTSFLPCTHLLTLPSPSFPPSSHYIIFPTSASSPSSFMSSTAPTVSFHFLYSNKMHPWFRQPHNTSYPTDSTITITVPALSLYNAPNSTK
jgi:hypothetical protein